MLSRQAISFLQVYVSLTDSVGDMIDERADLVERDALEALGALASMAR